MADLVVITNTAGQGSALPTALVARARKGARTRFLEFFTVNIRNPNTRAAYTRSAVEFCAGAKRGTSADSMKSSRSRSPPT
jgi:hypothetical protein